jgi:hypothetical protein
LGLAAKVAALHNIPTTSPKKHFKAGDLEGVDMENILNNKEKSVQRYAEGFHLIDN